MGFSLMLSTTVLATLPADRESFLPSSCARLGPSCPPSPRNMPRISSSKCRGWSLSPIWSMVSSIRRRVTSMSERRASVCVDSFMRVLEFLLGPILVRFEGVDRLARRDVVVPHRIFCPVDHDPADQDHEETQRS